MRNARDAGAPFIRRSGAERQDRRTDRRIEGDRRRRREPGGDSSGNWFQSDWAGRTILENYVTGGGDLHIDNDPRWSNYMMSSPVLQRNVDAEMTSLAQQLAASGQTGTVPINHTFHTNMENGEGIIGHQYLHGTNANVGDYNIAGTADIIRQNGTTTVNFDVSHTWNDVIDPNPGYWSDNVKSAAAEIFTLGQADAYDLSIEWDSQTSVEIDDSGIRPPTATGWPGN